jgi:catechol 2,3-dioxygenase-like lactoylglutathione lyase family enzyme
MPASCNHHIALRVADVDRAVAFYRAAFGVTPLLAETMEIDGEVAEMTVNGPPGTKLAIQMLTFPAGGAVELFAFAEPSRPNLPIDPWEANLMHFAVQVEDVEEALGKAVAAGAEQIWPEVLEMDPLRIVYIRDLDGNVIELINESMETMAGVLNGA